MRKFRALKMGTNCRDRATGLEGQITHWIIGMSGLITYMLQPKGLDDEGQPVNRLYLPLERLEVQDSDFEEVDIPFDALGTIVTDDASGFTGMAVHFVRHRNGCFHVVIQPSGLVARTGKPIKDHEFDIRGCSGEKIPVLTEAEKKESEREKPSPTGDPAPQGYCG